VTTTTISNDKKSMISLCAITYKTLTYQIPSHTLWHSRTSLSALLHS